MIERGVETSWAHFEVVAQGGWFKNLFYGKEPWAEVAFVDQRTLHLNPGVPKLTLTEIPTIPEKWRQESKGLWN